MTGYASGLQQGQRDGLEVATAPLRMCASRYRQNQQGQRDGLEVATKENVPDLRNSRVPQQGQRDGLEVATHGEASAFGALLASSKASATASKSRLDAVPDDAPSSKASATASKSRHDLLGDA